MKLHNEFKGNWMVAAAFAEAGEWETARSMIPVIPDKKASELSWFERIFSAVAFAEEGLHEEAFRLTGGKKRHAAHVFHELENLGLNMVHLRYGTICVD